MQEQINNLVKKNSFWISALVYNSFNEISECESEAVKEANKWKLIDNDSSPKISKIKNTFVNSSWLLGFVIFY